MRRLVHHHDAVGIVDRVLRDEHDEDDDAALAAAVAAAPVGDRHEGIFGEVLALAVPLELAERRVEALGADRVDVRRRRTVEDEPHRAARLHESLHEGVEHPPPLESDRVVDELVQDEAGGADLPPCRIPEIRAESCQAP